VNITDPAGASTLRGMYRLFLVEIDKLDPVHCKCTDDLENETNLTSALTHMGTILALQLVCHW
jgi:hypothetical protein